MMRICCSCHKPGQLPAPTWHLTMVIAPGAGNPMPSSDLYEHQVFTWHTYAGETLVHIKQEQISLYMNNS